MRVPSTDIPTLAGLRGLWRRSLIQRPSGTDCTTQVHWLQSHRFFIDLRRPRPARDFSHVRGLQDLTLEDCAWLARQEGFAGALSCDGTYFEWSRRIDYQPAAALPDAGTLHWQAEVLIERGRYADYVEHWHREPAHREPARGLALRNPDSGETGALVTVGPYFMWARNRAGGLPPGANLADCAAGCASVETARPLFDCEICFGQVADGTHRISQSTLPYRADAVFDIDIRGSRLEVRERADGGRQTAVTWDILEDDGPVHFR